MDLQDAIGLNFNTIERDLYVPRMSVQIADFNGDGHPDLLAGGALLFGGGDGTFEEATYPAPRTALDYPALWGWPADVDGDGLPDLVAAETAVSVAGAYYSRVAVYLNSGGVFPVDASFSLTLSSMMQPAIVALADLNGDGAADLILQDEQSLGGPSPLRIVLGNHDGTFQAATLAAPVATACSSEGTYVLEPGDVAVGDVTGDGVPDLVQLCARPAGPVFSVFPGVGDGTFGLPIVGPALGSSAPHTEYWRSAYFALGDFDGDGRLDIVESDAPSNQVGLFLGIGDGSFHPARILSTDRSPGPLAVADLNGDGKLDVTVAGFSETTLFIGRGDGTFDRQPWAGWSFGAHGYPPMALADINSDGRLDILLGDRWAVEEGLSCRP